MCSYRKILLSLSFLFLLSIPSVAQDEICSDAQDNDGDQFIDCYDSDCSGDPSCLEFYFGNDVICQDPPTEFPDFAMSLLWGSDNLTAQNSSTAAIGDIDGDGSPNVIVTNRISDRLSILDGPTGVTINQIFPGFDVAKTVAIANINDLDDVSDEDEQRCAWIFVRHFNGRRIKAYDCNLVEQWSINLHSDRKRANIISIADLNQDGESELISGNEIRDARTGSQLVAGTGNFRTDVMYGTVAVDILDDSFCADCGGLEIVDGSKIWAVQTDGSNNITGKTVALDMNDLLSAGNKFFPKYYSGWTNQWSMVSVADYNLDGNLDVLMTGAQGSNYNGPTTAFFWDVENNSVLTYTDPDNDHDRGTGRINIGDTDGDGNMNATYVSNQRLYSLDENMSPIWIKSIKEGSSGFTGCTVFDFNGDGAAETVYRSEDYLHIIDGTDGSTFNSRVCISRTYEDYPIVADVDGDGASEICVSCSTDDNQPFNPYNNSDNGHIRIFEADGESWQPARPVWNQHAYFNVNVNDDLTIPQSQQDHTKVFSENICTVGPNRPLNVFLNQAPYLNETGCPNYVAPDISVVNGSITSDTPSCPDLLFDVTLSIANTGDINVSGQLPITFYDGDPTLATSTRLNTAVATISSFEIGTTQDITVQALGTGTDFTMYVSVNDNGSQDPPIQIFVGGIPECDDTNNFGTIEVSATPLELQTNILKHDIRCDDTYPANGAAEAFYYGTISATTVEIWDEDFEDLSTDTSEDTGETAWSRTFTDNPSAYYAEVKSNSGDKEFTFNKTITESVWTSEVIDISGLNDIEVSMELRAAGPMENSDYIRAYYILDGETAVALEDGLQQNDDFGTVIARTANPLNGSTLQLRIESMVSWQNEYYFVDDILVTGTTDAIEGAITNDYTFYWFEGTDFSAPVFTGDTYTEMAAGTYSVFATSITNSCQSDTVTVVIDPEENDPVVQITQVQPKTDCENPNGILLAEVIVDGNPAPESDYSFTWYIGSDVGSPVSLEATADNLDARNYTVEVIDNKSGCVTTASESVVSNTVDPVVNLNNIGHITVCNDPSSGSISVTAGGLETGFTFNWYDGDETKFSPDFTGSGAAGSTYDNIEAGFYTVEIVDEATGCLSAPMTFEVEDQSGAPAVDITLIQNNESCTDDGSGAFSVTSGGETDGFTFEFFEGISTQPENAINTVSGPNNSIVQLLDAGDYTVRVTEDATGCATTTQTSIIDDITYPTPDDDVITIGNVSFCNAVGSANGSIDASATVVGLDAGDIDVPEGNENGSFESPDISGSFDQLDEGLVPGWQTTAPDNEIEIWTSGFQGVPAQEGNQFAEINSSHVAALFFDQVTKPGILMNWSFWHRARGGDGTVPDVMDLKIGDASDPNNLTVITTASSLKEWTYYSGTYLVPAGQTITRFQYEAVSTASGSVSVGNFVDDIKFEIAPFIFNLYEGGSSSSPADLLTTNTSGIFEGLTAGTYTVQIANNITGCGAPDMVVEVGILENTPQIAAGAIEHDSYCGAVGNGSQEITVSSDVSVGEPAAGYSFELFDAHNSDPSNLISGPTTIADGSTGTTYEDLADGNYRVQITNLDSDCSEVLDFVINDISGPPGLGTPIISPQTSCMRAGNGNGFISATVVSGSVDDYTFTWYEGIGTGGTVIKTDIAGGVDEGQSITGRDAGDYTVVATNIVSECPSNPLSINIPEQIENPDVTIVEVSPQITCPGGTPTGSLRAYVSEADQPGIELTEPEYTFEWFVGVDAAGVDLQADPTGGNGSNATDADNNTVSGLAAPVGNATYTVRVTSASTGCTNTATVVLSNESVLPEITNVARTDDTGCNAESADGTITLSASLDGVAIDFSSGDYDITLYTGATTVTEYTNALSPLAINNNTGVIDGVESGEYTVTITNTTTNCESDPSTFTLGSDPNEPDILISDANNTENSVCDPVIAGTYDGVIHATIDGGADPDDYTISWFVGQNTNADNNVITGINGVTGAVAATNGTNDATLLSNVPGGIYTLRVVNDATDCSGTFEYTLGDDIDTPGGIGGATILTSLDHVEQCDDGDDYPDGSITVTSIDGNDATDYSYTWYHGNSVDADSILVVDGSVDIFDATNKNITRSPNVNIEENAAGATVVLSGINQGAYTFVATSLATGCPSDPVNVEILNQPITITATAVTGNNSVCMLTATATEYDGIITTTLTGTDTDANNYNWEWFSGLNDNAGQEIATTVPTADVSTNGVLDQVPSGDYTVRLTHSASNCSELISFNVGDGTDTPGSGAGFVTSLDHVEQCDDGDDYPDGSITVTSIDGNDATDYSYTWYHGNSVDADSILVVDGSVDIFDATNKNITRSPNVNIEENAAGTTVVLSGINQGAYTFVATSLATGCPSDPVNVEILNQPITITATAVTGNNSVCMLTATATEYDGIITTTLTGTDTDANNYNWEWFSGLNDNAGQEIATTVPTADVSTNGVLDQVPSGDYTVRLTHSASNCSELISFNVGDGTDTPGSGAGFVTSLDHVEQCDDGDDYPDGSITVTSIDGNDATDYSYTWYHGNSVDADSILVVDGSVDIFDATNKNITRSPNVNIEENAAGATVVLSGINQGAYTFVATSLATGCPSDPVNVEILNQPITITATAVTGNNSVCMLTATATEYDGIITTTLTGTDTDANNYNWEWFSGLNDNAGQEIATTVPTADVSTNGVLDQVPSGDYTVRLTHSASNCSELISFNVGDGTDTPGSGAGFVTSLDHVEQCDDGDDYPDGSITVTSIDGNDATDYSYTWYHGNSVDADSILVVDGSVDIFDATNKNITRSPNVNIEENAAGTTVVLSGINQGAYTFVATSLATGCPSDPVNVEILNQPITITATAVTGNNSVCMLTATATEYDGIITTTLTGTDTDANNYNWEWFSGLNDNAGQEIATTVPTADVSTNGVLDQVPSGDYTVRLTHSASNCSELISFNVGDGTDTPGSGAGFVTSLDHVEQCDDGDDYPDGSITVTSIDGNDATDYSYTWYHGNSVDADSILVVDGSVDIFDATNKNITRSPNVNIEENAAGTTVVLSGINQGAYTFVATSLATGCPSDPVNVEILNQPITITATAVTGNNSVCMLTATATEYDGIITTTLTGTDTDANNYNWEWFSGLNDNAGQEIATTVPTADVSTNGVLDQVPSGDYTVRLTHSASNCSELISFNVGDGTDTPGSGAGFVTSLDHVEQCDDGDDYPDGSITVTSIDGNDATDYSYTWYHGNSVDADSILVVDGSVDIFDATNKNITRSPNVNIEENAAGATVVLSGINQGAYTFVATSLATGCPSDPVNVEILNQPITITATAVTGNNSVCMLTATATEYDGIITTTLTGTDTDANNYNWEWFSGLNDNAGQEIATTVPTADVSTNGVLDQVPSGDYTVRLTHSASNCSELISFNVGDGTDTPGSGAGFVTSLDHVEQCDDGDDYPDGSITVTSIDGNDATDYSYTWYHGNSVDADSILVVDGSVDIFDATNKNITRSPNVNIEENAAGTTVVLSGINQGAYTFVATSLATGCPSDPVNVEILNQPITITATAVTGNNSVCMLTATATEYDGIITTTLTGTDTDANNYNWEWFSGLNDNAGQEIATTVPTADVSTNGVLDQVPSGDYTVRLTHSASNCSELISFNVGDGTDTPGSGAGFVTSLDHVEQCDDGDDYPDGSITVTSIDGNDATDYSYTWYHGNSVDADSILVVDGSVDIFDATNKNITRSPNVNIEENAAGATVVLSGINQGAYTFVATSLATGCPSDPVNVEILNNASGPTFNLVLANEQTHCSTPNGQIQVTITSFAAGDEHTINFYEGPSAIGTPDEQIVATTNAIELSTTGFDSYQFTVEVINLETNCSSVDQILITENLNEPSLDNAVAAPSTYCTPGVGDGTITITASGLGGDTPIYAIYPGSSTVGGADSTSADNVFENLPAGTYTVTVRNTASDCETSGTTKVITSDFTGFTSANINITTENEQTACDFSNPNGSLSADVNGGDTGYTYRWYRGDNTNAANEILTGITNTATDSEVTDLAAGTYTVQVTNTTTGCIRTNKRTITNEETVPTLLSATPADNSSCSSPDGTITVEAEPGGGAQVTDGQNGYQFQLFYAATIAVGATPDETIASLAANTPDDFEDLPDGDYSVRVIDNFTGCYTDQENIIINYSGPEVTIDESLVVKGNISTCFSSNGTLDVTNALVSVTGGYTGHMDITWYVGTDPTTPNELLTVVPGASQSTLFGAAPGGGDIINGSLANLPAVVYTGVIELDNGCTQIITTELNQAGSPSLTLSAPVDPLSCVNPQDGEFEITIDLEPGFGDTADEFTFYVFEGEVNIGPNTNPTPPDYAPALSTYPNRMYTASFTNNGVEASDNLTFNTGLGLEGGYAAQGIGPGIYTVAVEVGADKCIVEVKTIELEEPESVEITLDAAGTANNYVCDVVTDNSIDYNGIIEVDAAHPTLGGNFNFTWEFETATPGVFADVNDGVDGAGTGSNVTGESTNNSLNAVLSGVGPGTYRVTATHITTGCTDVFEYELETDDNNLSIGAVDPDDFEIDHILDCGDDGAFTITRVTETLNGSTTFVSGAGLTTNYSSSWYDITNSAALPAYDNVFTANDLAAGDYRITLVNDIGGTPTGCSAFVEFTIEDQTENPVIALVGDITHNSNCGGTGNGELTIRVENEAGVVQTIPGNYDVQWYENSGLTVDIGTALDGQEDGTVDNLRVFDLEAATYYVEVIDLASTSQNCAASASFTVIDELPEVSMGTDSDLAGGDDDIAISHVTCAADGSLEILQVIYEGADDTNIGNYSFEWFEDENEITTVKATANVYDAGGTDYTGTDISGLPAGSYFIRATRNVVADGNLCPSELVEYTILDNSVLPVITFTIDQEDTYCGGATVVGGTGEITANAQNGAATYTSIEWFYGSGTGTTLAASGIPTQGTSGTNGQTATGLPDGTYTVRFTDDNCVSTAEIVLGESTPVISLVDTEYSATHIECATTTGGFAITDVVFDGQLAIDDLTMAFTDFTFLYEVEGGGASGGTPGGTNGESITGLAEGDYQVTVTWDDGLCPSSTLLFSIEDNSVPPVITFTIDQEDTYCGGATVVGGTGEITANAQNGAATYTSIEWFYGSGTGTTLAASGIPTQGTSGTNGQTATGLPDGTYTVRFTDDNCVSTAEIVLGESTPVISLVDTEYSATHIECATTTGGFAITDVVFDGQLAIDDLTMAFTDFTFLYEVEGGGASGGTPGGTNGESITGLAEGDYQVTVTWDDGLCPSSTLLFSIEDNSVPPVITFTIDQEDTYCGGATVVGGTGEITANAQNGAATYTSIEWFYGSGTGTTLAASGIPTQGTSGTNGQTATGLPDGTYTVRFTDDNCVSTAEIVLGESTPVISLVDTEYSATHIECATTTGGFAITDVVFDGQLAIDDLTMAFTDFTFLYEVEGGGASGGTPGGTNGESITGLAEGDYQVTVTWDDGLCPSSTLLFSIEDNSVPPVITFTIDQEDTYCGGATVVGGTGEITANAQNGAATYTSIEWFYGSGTGTTLAASGIPTQGTSGTNGQTATGLPDGTYTVRFTDDNCVSTAEIVLGESTPVISLVDTEYSATHIECATTTGGFAITDVVFDGQLAIDDLTMAFTDFTFLYEVEGGGASGGTPGGTNGESITGLAEGDYQVTVTWDDGLCPSSTLLFSIEDNSVPPVITFTIDQEDTYCGGATVVGGTGEITANAQNGAATYTSIEWFYGSGTGTTLAASGIPTQGTSGTNGQTATGLPDGTYTVRFTDDNCVSTAEIVLGESTPVISLVDTEYSATHIECATTTGGFAITDVVFDGQLAIDDLTMAFTDFTFLYEVEGGGASGGTPGGTNGESITGLAEGDYQVTVTWDDGLCPSSTLLFSIEDNSVPPVITFTIDQEDTYCGGATVVGGTGEITANAQNGAATYTSIEWFYGSGTGTTLAASGIPTQGTSGTNGQTATGLPDGTYTVRFTDDNCVSTAEIVLGESTPVISLVDTEYSATHIECATTTGGFAITDVVFDGQLAIDDLTMAFTDFTFLYEVEGGGASGGTPGGTNGESITGLAEGDYQVTVTWDDGLCPSSTLLFSIEDNSVPPVITFTIDQEDTYCGGATVVGGTGEITANAQNGAATYTSIEWFYGSGTGTTLAASGIPTQGTSGTNGQTATGLPDGTYTVRFTDDNCVSTAEIVLGESTPVISLVDTEYSATHIECATTTGGFAITDVVFDGQLAIDDLTMAFTDFTFLYEVEGGGASGGTPGGTNGESITGLAEGDYQVTVTWDDGLCPSSTLLFSIEDNSVPPVITFTIDQEDTYCGGATVVGGTGEITANAQNGAATYTSIEWFYGSGTGTTLAASGIPTQGTSGTNGQTATGLPDGTYTVRFTDDNCVSTAEIVLGESLPELSIDTENIAAVAITDNINCPDFVTYFGSGAIEINEVLENGSVDYAIGNYDFDWSSSTLPTGGSITTVDANANDRVENLVADTYSVEVTNNVTGCTTDSPIEIVLEDDPTDPSGTVAKDRNTICDAAIAGDFNGTIEVTASTGAGTNTYSFDWNLADGNPMPGSASISATTTVGTADLLDEEEYEVLITDLSTGCTSTIIETIENTLTFPTLVIPDARITDVDDCGGAAEGIITLEDGDITGTSVGLAGYEFEMYDVDIIDGTLTADATYGTAGAYPGGGFVNRAIGRYSIVAIDQATGCTSGGTQAVVEDVSVLPQITIDDITADINCGGTGLGIGAITISADAGVDTYLWSSGETVATIADKTSGVYTIDATNSTTNCTQSLDITIPDEAMEPIITSITSGDQTECNADGSVTVVEITFNGDVTSEADFTFDWGTTNMGNDLFDDVAGMNVLPDVSAGDYFTTLTHTQTNCSMLESVQINVDDEVVYPLVTITQDDADQNCTGTGDTGILTALGDGVDDTDPNYTFAWYEGTSATGTVISNTSQATGINAGQFTVLVTNTATGCTMEETATLSNVPLEPAILAFDTVGSSNCGALANGSITITSVSIGAISDYTFQFYDNSQLVGALQNSDAATMTDLEPGVYFVTATHNGAANTAPTNCVTPSIQVEVSDLSMPPVITINNVTLQSNCDQDNPNGEISVLADDQILGYTFAWYEGKVVNPGAEISNTQTASGLSVGSYTVMVTNNTTGCSSVEIYNMIDDIESPIMLSTSSSPNSNCVDFDGRMSVTVLNPALAAEDYDYFWYSGEENDPENATPILTGNFQDSLMHGTYTVFVSDPVGGCTSEPTFVTIDDETNMGDLSFLITEEASLTNCDPERPNGIVSVEAVSGVVSDYYFEWFRGEDNTGEYLGRGLKQDSLSAETYFIEMHDRYTGCMISTTTDVADSTKVVTGVEGIVISDRTNCVTPNGEALSLVHGETFGYTFEWRDQPTDAGNLLGSSSGIIEIDEGSYYVKATSNQTGCSSEYVQVDIANARKNPIITLDIEEATCNMMDGSATIRYDVPVELNYVHWREFNNPQNYQEAIRQSLDTAYVNDDNNSLLISEDFKLSGISGGQYFVEVSDINSCNAKAVFEVETDIVIYNGVSDNGDGKNDIFRIDCAENFLNNHVKIYNRTGALVFEASGYDNDVVVFKGQSNTGIGANGRGLPEGTYFYTFDKGDGEKIIQGFLELVR